MGLGFTFALALLGTVREILGAGTILGYDITFGVYKPAIIFILPPGAFITLGCLIAVINKIRSTAELRKKEKSIDEAVEIAGKEIENG